MVELLEADGLMCGSDRAGLDSIMGTFIGSKLLGAGLKAMSLMGPLSFLTEPSENPVQLDTGIKRK